MKITLHGDPEDLKTLQFELSVLHQIVCDYEKKTGLKWSGSKKAVAYLAEKVDETINAPLPWDRDLGR